MPNEAKNHWLETVCHNALIFRDILALFVYRLHFVFTPVLSLTCRRK